MKESVGWSVEDCKRRGSLWQDGSTKPVLAKTVLDTFSMFPFSSSEFMTLCLWSSSFSAMPSTTIPYSVLWKLQSGTQKRQLFNPCLGCAQVQNLYPFKSGIFCLLSMNWSKIPSLQALLWSSAQQQKLPKIWRDCKHPLFRRRHTRTSGPSDSATSSSLILPSFLVQRPARSMSNAWWGYLLTSLSSSL